MIRKIERIETIGVLLGDNLVDVSVRIWEPKDSKSAIICIHGFGGTSEDFAPLAETLVKVGITVIAPDMFGRGLSSFFGIPDAYKLRIQLTAIAVTKRYQKEKNCHLGTSWGGLMMLSHLVTQNWPTSGLILNDCPIDSNIIPKDHYQKLKIESTRIFPSWNQAEEYVLTSRKRHFLTGSWKDRFVASRLRKVDDGWRMNYDPALKETLSMKQFSIKKLLSDAPKPVLMNFGKDSPYANDPRNVEIAKANKNVTVLNNMSDIHPPSLMRPDQILTISGYLGQCLI